MKKILLLLFCSYACVITLQAQQNISFDSSVIITLNQQIDNYVVQQNIAALDKLYAPDFVFSHGSGKVEGRQGWFKSVAKGSFVTRQHDSVTVEMHTDIAVVRGRLSVHKKTEKENSKYHLKYVRVFVLRDKQWQLISHITVWEQHEL